MYLIGGAIGGKEANHILCDAHTSYQVNKICTFLLSAQLVASISMFNLLAGNFQLSMFNL